MSFVVPPLGGKGRDQQNARGALFMIGNEFLMATQWSAVRCNAKPAASALPLNLSHSFLLRLTQ